MTSSAIRGADKRAVRQLTVDGRQLAHELQGSGEPVLSIPPGPIAGAFAPLMLEQAVLDGYGVIRYHRRGQGGSAPPATPVGFADRASDAALLLDHLGVRRAHVVGHSAGAGDRLQLAVEHPAVVETLACSTLPAVRGPERRSLLGQRGTVDAGDPREPADHAEQAGHRTSPLPALPTWTFGAEQTAAISQPVLGEPSPRAASVWPEPWGTSRECRGAVVVSRRLVRL